MSTLVIAEHDNNSLKVSTLNTVAAAHAMGANRPTSVVALAVLEYTESPSTL